MIKILGIILGLALLLFIVSAIFSGSGLRSALPTPLVQAGQPELAEPTVRGVSNVAGAINAVKALEVTTLGFQPIDSRTAVLNGEVDLNSSNEAEVFFRYGTSQSALTEKTETLVLTTNQADAYRITLTGLAAGTTYHYQAVAIGAGGVIAEGQVKTFGTTQSFNFGASATTPDVRTRPAGFVEIDSAQLRGEVYSTERFTPLLAFFIYGDERDTIEAATTKNTFNSIAIAGDSLQKLIAERSVREDGRITLDARRLPRDRNLFYTFCVEYEFEGATELTCGEVSTFETEDTRQRSNGQSALATTLGATEGEITTATIRGTVNMNDSENGIVFFVYGEDEEDITEVSDLREFSQVEEDDEDLIRARVDRDLDTNRTYELEIDSLRPGRDYFYRICVEFENEIRISELACGGVQEFEADREDDRN